MTAATKRSVQPIPDGSHTVTPYLVAEGVPKLIDFVKQAEWLVKATDVVLLMVKQLRHLQQIEKVNLLFATK